MQKRRLNLIKKVTQEHTKNGLPFESVTFNKNHLNLQRLLRCLGLLSKAKNMKMTSYLRVMSIAQHYMNTLFIVNEEDEFWDLLEDYLYWVDDIRF